MRGWLGRLSGAGRPTLRISQSLGAFGHPVEGISPLYVFFEVTNTGTEEVGVARIHVSAGDPARPVHEGPFGGDPAPPFTLAPGESRRFHTRARALAGDLEQAGHGGRPRVKFVVVDDEGNRSARAFRFRVDEYLRLKDE